VNGRHQRRHTSALIVGAAGLALVVVAGLGWGGYQLVSRHSCTGVPALTVDAAPEIAPAIQAAADQLAASGTQRGSCLTVKVSGVDPADVAVSIAATIGATVPGLTQVTGAHVPIPDVWVPDSTTWLQRVASTGTNLAPGAGTSLAVSPIVLAVPQPLAQPLGWPGTALTWPTLLQKVNVDRTLKMGVVEPGRDAASLATLLALHAVAESMGPAGQDATVATLRSLAGNRSTARTSLLAQFPTSSQAAAQAPALTAITMSEQAAIAYNATRPTVPVAAVPIDPSPAALDYPFAILPGAGASVAGATQLRAVLEQPAFRAKLAKYGLRPPNGAAGPGLAAISGTARVTSLPLGDPTLIDQTLSTWSSVTQPGRMLAVIDVSGSMLDPVPTAGNASREQVTVKAAAAGLALLDSGWDVGLWTFATGMDGPRPYRQLLPIGPLATQRGALAAAIGRVNVNPKGDTALYETVLAAYQTVQADWDATKVNSVVLLTDGLEDNPDSPKALTLEQLTGRLQQIVDPQRPVQVILLGIGTQVPRGALDRITQITGGGVFIATDPASIGRIFLQAIALRPGGATGN
jgi:hypothetical protein